MSRAVDTPWNPATTAMLPASIVSWMRSARISTILALRWAVSVTIPACEPVNETAGSPRSMIAMHSSAVGDALARGEQHVHLAFGRVRGHIVGEPLEVVGGLAHGRNHHDDVVAVAPGAHDVVGDGPDAIGIGHRRSTEFLDEQSHDAQF